MKVETLFYSAIAIFSVGYTDI